MTTAHTAGATSNHDESHASGSRTAPLRLAIIDGDSGFLQVVEKRVRARGWQQTVLGGAVPVEELVSMRLGALVIDLAVLGAPGWAYLEQVCAALPALPVIVCTGPSTVAQRVRALRTGADDWLGKPCHPEELVARIEAIVRRGRLAAPPVERPVVEAGEIAIRPDQFQAFVGTRSLDLTRREFELIRLLAGNAGQVLERETIYQRVWGYAMAHGDRSVDVFVRKLRQKLERASPQWRYIHTHFGVGYRFAPEPIEQPDAIGSTDAPEETAGDALGDLRERVLQ
ncbi:response regulator transcription factor [Conexibacter arvalis]|uniref:DNA-binding response OmpR family regulator n=1 Tax=Conexibacter arvalis TaxID=912552 RepID=A0A840IJH2_9ACTN|nr:response regulator transcription factor [Conexibacter arvalis]MBB4664485.1 DNA-binding response OmpR family regulator [Conexibacter arvalis]